MLDGAGAYELEATHDDYAAMAPVTQNWWLYGVGVSGMLLLTTIFLSGAN